MRERWWVSEGGLRGGRRGGGVGVGNAERW